MSEQDRKKWDARYRAGAYAERLYPSAFLAERSVDLPQGHALDVACGRGRNSIFLAAQGFVVDAIDISSVGLEHGRAQAKQADVNVNWICQDLLTDTTLPRDTYAAIIVFRFVAADLLRLLQTRLCSGGILLVEEHLGGIDRTGLTGPRGNRFRVARGELAGCVPDLEILYEFEGIVTEPDGGKAALARLMARNGSARAG